MTSNYKNSLYPRSFLCEKAKIKQRIPLKKELREIGEKAIWESRFTSFFFIHAITILSLFRYSVCDKRVKIILNMNVNKNESVFKKKKKLGPMSPKIGTETRTNLRIFRVQELIRTLVEV